MSGIYASTGLNFNPPGINSRNTLYIHPKGIYYVAPVVDPPEADRLPPLKVRDLRLDIEQISADFELKRFEIGSIFFVFKIVVIAP